MGQPGDRDMPTRERNDGRDNRDPMTGRGERDERLRRSALEDDVELGLSARAGLVEQLSRLESGVQQEQAFRDELVDRQLMAGGQRMAAGHHGQHTKRVERTAGQRTDVAQHPDR